MMQDSQWVNTCAMYILTTANAIVPLPQTVPLLDLQPLNQKVMIIEKPKKVA